MYRQVVLAQSFKVALAANERCFAVMHSDVGVKGVLAFALEVAQVALERIVVLVNRNRVRFEIVGSVAFVVAVVARIYFFAVYLEVVFDPA